MGYSSPLGAVNGGQRYAACALGAAALSGGLQPAEIPQQLKEIEIAAPGIALGQFIDLQQIVPALGAALHGTVGPQKPLLLQKHPDQLIGGHGFRLPAERFQRCQRIPAEVLGALPHGVIKPGRFAACTDLCQLIVGQPVQGAAQHRQQRHILMGIIQYPQKAHEHLYLRGGKQVSPAVGGYRDPSPGQSPLVDGHGVPGAE